MFADEALTEAGWLTARDCDAAAWMVRRLWMDGPRLSARKSQLYVCACGRRVWQVLTDPVSRQAIEVAERYADGLASRDEATEAAEAAARAREGSEPDSPAFWARNLAGLAAYPADNRWNDWLAPNAMWWLGFDPSETPAELLRDIVGNPFRPMTADPAWRSWLGGAIPVLARGVYDDRAFDRLPVLADVLEEAGCSSADLLAHLRSPGPHVRGCWAVDLLLGKECGRQ